MANAGIDFEQQRTPYFHFPEIPPCDPFVFEKLTTQNHEQLYLLFKTDPSPFVDDRFKHKETVYEYALDIEQYGCYSPKHGGQDWLVRFAKGSYLSVLHLYDLSLETWADNDKRAWIGFATTEAFRRQGFTLKIGKHFIDYVFRYYPNIDYLHAMTLKENLPAQQLLMAAGFVRDMEERMSKRHCFYVLKRVEWNTQTQRLNEGA